MDNHEVLLEKQDRVLKTMQGIKTDRPPLMMSGDCALMRYARPGISFRYILEHHEELNHVIVDEVLPKLPKLDLLGVVAMSPRYLGSAFLTKTLLPGIDLPDDEMWQLAFDYFMEEDDYDKIISGGWAPFRESVMKDRLHLDPETMAPEMEAAGRNMQNLHDAGIPFTAGGMLCSPFDSLVFIRGATDFFIDLYERPEEVLEVMDIMMSEEEEVMRNVIPAQVAELKEKGEVPLYSVAPCVHANCSLLGREQFEKFGWPLLERETNFLLSMGVKVMFHMDANWTKFLDFFTCFPKGQCIFDSDGNTDLNVIHDLLGPRMAFTGSISPAMFAFGTPDEVYKTASEQIETMGDSFIAAPSCSIPANAPAANIDALYAAVDDH